MSKIYTSYFYQVRNFPKNYVPVSICLTNPNWYWGKIYTKLIPSKRTIRVVEEAGEYGKVFADAYLKYTLEQLNPHQVYKELLSFATSADKDVVILGYEVPTDEYSERFIVAKWLAQYGYTLEEFKGE